VWQTLSWVRLGSGKCDTDSWVGGGAYMVNVVARRIAGWRRSTYGERGS
jgi:hypothetical protein